MIQFPKRMWCDRCVCILKARVALRMMTRLQFSHWHLLHFSSSRPGICRTGISIHTYKSCPPTPDVTMGRVSGDALPSPPAHACSAAGEKKVAVWLSAFKVPRSGAQWFVDIVLFYPEPPLEQDIFLPMSQLRKLKVKEVKLLAWGPTDQKWRSPTPSAQCAPNQTAAAGQEKGWPNCPPAVTCVRVTVTGSLF